MTYDWLNPPVGNYSIEEYLGMHKYWMRSISADGNERSRKADPMGKKYFGDKLIVHKDGRVILEAI